MAQVVAAGQFADGVHGEGGQTDVHGAHAQLSGGDGPDGGAATHVAAHHETLHRHPFTLAEIAEEGRGLAAGGIALVGIHLDDRSGVQFRAVVAIVLDQMKLYQKYFPSCFKPRRILSRTRLGSTPSTSAISFTAIPR